MIDGIEPLYRQIAESMVDAIPEAWRSARFEAIFFPDGSTYEAEYVRAADRKVRSFLPHGDGDRAFRQLRRMFKEQGRPLWGRACFELFPDGKFNMNFGYDDCDEHGNARFDEDMEAKRREARQRRLTS